MEKERRTKALLLSTLVVVVATLSIAFAAMSRTLSINGIGKMDTASWSVYFANLSDAIADGAEEEGKPNINAIDKGIIENINVKLFNPGDEISYKVDIVNDGTIDAEITMIKDIELTDVQKKVFEFKVTYTDTGEVLKDGDVLPAGDTKNITINIKFRDDITESDLPTEQQIINLSYQIIYTQYDGGNLPVGPNGGGVTTEKAILTTSTLREEWEQSVTTPADLPFYNGTLARKHVKSITFLDSSVVPAEYSSTAWDASLNKDGSVMAWFDIVTYKLYIGGNGGVYAPSDSFGLFSAFCNVEEINFNGNFKTTDVTNMSYMFSPCFDLNTLDLSSFDTSNVTNMSHMFDACEKIASLNLDGFKTEKVTNMSYMFARCKSLTELDLSSFDTSKVTDMSYMFSNYITKESMSIETINLSSFNTKSVTDMSYMFDKCHSLKNINISDFDISSVTNMSYMFSGCSSLTNMNLNNFNAENIDMSYMFNGCSSLTNVDLSNFNATDTNMTSFFEDCTSLNNVKMFNSISSTQVKNMFSGSGITSLDLSNVKVSGSAAYMFANAKNLKTINLISFDTSNVTNMSYMFSFCTSLTTLDLSGFDTSNVTTMTSMFNDCTSLTSIDVSKFNTINVTGMSYMFDGCSSLSNLNIDGFDFRKATISSFCRDCKKLTTINANNIQFSKSVLYFKQLFSGAKTSLETVNMKNLQVSGSLTSFSGLFSGFTALKKVDMQGANISIVTNTSTMFSGCTSLNEIIIDGFDLSKVTTKTNMFANVPENFTIYVKDEASKNVVSGLRSDANIIIGAPTAFNMNTLQIVL